LEPSESSAPVQAARLPPWLRTTLLALVHLWSAVLAIQNGAVIAAAREGIAISPVEDANSRFLWTMLIWSLIRLTVLVLAALTFARRKNGFTSALYCLAILFCFPFGLLLQQAIGRLPAMPGLLLSTSAILSYLAASLLLLMGRELIGSRREATAA